MPRIVHSALKVDDLEKATEFYEKGFGFVEMEAGQVIDHTRAISLTGLSILL